MLAWHSSGHPQGSSTRVPMVVLLYYDGTDLCRVVDGAGRYVDTRFDGLRKLQAQ